MVLFLMGLIAYPFSRMFLFGVQGSHDNSYHIIAYNLAREKIEEIRSLPFDMVKSDFDNFRNIYRDRVEFDEVFEDEKVFENTFSDVFSKEQLQKSKVKETFHKLQELYREKFCRDLDLYPEALGGFRRLLLVDDKYDHSVPPRLKKVSVQIFDRRNRKIAEVVTLVGRHK